MATYLALKNKIVSVDHDTCNLWWTNHLHHLRMVDLYHFPCIPTCSQLSSSWGAFEKELHNPSAWLPAAGIMPSMPISPRIKPTNKGTASTWSRLELESLVRTAFFRQTWTDFYNNSSGNPRECNGADGCVTGHTSRKRFQGNVHGVAAISFCAAECFPSILSFWDSVTPGFFQRWMNARFVGPPIFPAWNTGSFPCFPLSRWPTHRSSSHVIALCSHRHSSQFTPKCTVPKIPKKKLV